MLSLHAEGFEGELALEETPPELAEMAAWFRLKAGPEYVCKSP